MLRPQDDPVRQFIARRSILLLRRPAAIFPTVIGRLEIISVSPASTVPELSTFLINSVKIVAG